MERVTAPPLTFHLKHEMKSRLEAGVYGCSEKRCSADSLFPTTTSACKLNVPSWGKKKLPSETVAPESKQERKGDQVIWFFFTCFVMEEAASLTLKWDRQSRWGPHSEPLLDADGLSGICAWNVQHKLPMCDFADRRTTKPVLMKSVWLRDFPQIHFKLQKLGWPPFNTPPEALVQVPLIFQAVCPVRWTAAHLIKVRKAGVRTWRPAQSQSSWQRLSVGLRSAGANGDHRIQSTRGATYISSQQCQSATKSLSTTSSTTTTKIPRSCFH